MLGADQVSAVDDQGASYRFSASLGSARAEWSGVLDLHPDPPHQIRWLDLCAAPGEPATRIDLDPRHARPAPPPPQITVIPAAVSPGELLLAGIAGGFLALAAPEQVPLHPSAAPPGTPSHAADGLADIIAALQAAGALPASSRLPGQLAGLCARLGISGHGITAPPAAGLPGPWLSLLAYCRGGTPEQAPAGPSPRPGCPSWTAPGSRSPACITASTTSSCTCWPAASRRSTPGPTAR